MATVNILEDKLKQIKDTFRQIEIDNLYDDTKIGLEKFKVIKQLISEVLKELANIKKEAILQRQNMIAAESTPVLAKNLSGNTDLQNKTPQLAGPVVEKKKSLLSDDLDVLIKRMYDGKLKFDQGIHDESIRNRQEYLAKAFARGGIGGVIKGLKKMPGIKTRKSIGEILGTFAKDSKVIKRIEEKKASFTADHKFVRLIQNVRKVQKKKKGASYMGTVARLIAGGLINKLIDRVKLLIDRVVTTAKVVLASTTTGTQLLNESTRISADLHEFGSATKTTIKSGIKFATKVVKGTMDVLSVGGKVVSSAVGSILPSAAVFIVTGGSVPLTIGYMTASTGIRTYLKILKDPNLSSIKFIRDAQIRHGTGMFYDINGHLKADAFNLDNPKSVLHGTSGDALAMNERITSQKALGRLDTRLFRVISSAEALMTWAPIGAAIAGFLGINPIIGGLVGGLGAVGIRAAWDAFKGRKAILDIVTGVTKQNLFFRALSQIPFTELYGQYQTNMWFGMQIDMIKNRYHGNFGEYFRENWDFTHDANIFKTLLVVSNVLQVGGVGLSIASGIMGSFMLKASSVVFRLGSVAGLVKTIGLSAPQVTGAYMLGTGLAIGTLLLLGVPLGPAMIMGAMIGSAIGCGLGIAISVAVSGLTAGFLSWASFGIITGMTTLGGIIGGWFGSTLDKALGLTGGMMMNFLQGMMALYQMLSLLQQQINLSNVMPIAIGLITLMSTLYRMGVFDTSNQCLDEQYCPLTTTTSLNNQPNLLELKAFGVYLISPPDSRVDSDTVGIITSFLDTNSAELHNKFGTKTVFINLIGTESYIDEQFVILGIDINSNNSIEALSKSLNISINNAAKTQDSQESDYAFLNIK